jgi:outer membrane usher protein
MRPIRSTLLFLAIAHCLPALAAAPASVGTAVPAIMPGFEAPPADEPLILRATTTDVPGRVVFTFTPEGDALVAPGSTWDALGVIMSDEEKASPALSSLAMGLTFDLDPTEATVRFHLPAHRRPMQVIGDEGLSIPKAGPMPKGVLLNYDLAVTGDQYGFTPDLGLAMRWGFAGGVFNAFGRVSEAGYTHDALTWTRDFPDSARVLQFGDVFNGPSNVAGSPGLLGVRYASDASLIFDSDRGIPRLGGLADRRSTIDLYLNDRLAGQQPIDAGPFTFDRLPVTTGYNRVRLVVRDEQGREQVVERSFFYDPRLLVNGETQFDVSAGLLPVSNATAATAFYRRGMADRWTAGFGGQFSGDGRNLTMENAFVVGPLGVIGLDLGTSQGPSGQGHSFAANGGYQGPTWSLAVGHQRRENWWDLGVSEGSDPGQRDQQTTSVSFTFRPEFSPWSASAAYVDGSYGDRRSRVLDIGAGYGFDRHDINLRAGYDFERPDNGWSIGLTYGYAFGNRTRARTNIISDTNGTRVGAALTGQAWQERESPVHWALTGITSRYGSAYGATASTRLTAFDVDGSVSLTNRDWRASGRLAGSLWLGEGGPLFQRPVYDSFALVKAEGYEDVPITMNNAPLGTVGRTGHLLVPSAPSRTSLQFRADGRNLPFGTSITPELEPTSAIRNGGVLVTFPAPRQSREIVLLGAEGQPLPVGTLLTGPGGFEAMVGYDGLAWLDQASDGDDWTAKTAEGLECRFTLPALEGSEQQTIRCN